MITLHSCNALLFSLNATATSLHGYTSISLPHVQQGSSKHAGNICVEKCDFCHTCTEEKQIVFLQHVQKLKSVQPCTFICTLTASMGFEDMYMLLLFASATCGVIVIPVIITQNLASETVQYNKRWQHWDRKDAYTNYQVHKKKNCNQFRAHTYVS